MSQKDDAGSKIFSAVDWLLQHQAIHNPETAEAAKKHREAVATEYDRWRSSISMKQAEPAN